MDFLKSEKQFTSPQEELEYLRKKVAGHEKAAEIAGMVPDSEKFVAAEIKKYSERLPETALAPQARMNEVEIAGIALKLSPEEHDKSLEELMIVVQNKGIKNALTIVEKTGNPHLVDDFHRMLVALIKTGFETKLNPKHTLTKALKVTLFQVQLPELKNEDKKPLKELISSMEQLFAGLLSVTEQKTNDPSQDFFSIELALPNMEEEYAFYVAIPDARKELFEKHILALFPSARLIAMIDDYNIFNEDGVTIASVATPGRNAVFPIKTYEQFDADPLNTILNSFSKIDKEGEGAAIQLIYKPAAHTYVNRYAQALEDIQKGTPVKKAINIPNTVSGEFIKIAGDMFSPSTKPEDKSQPQTTDQIVVEEIKSKISSPIVRSNLRIVASAQTEVEAQDILTGIESSFNQFNNTQGNSIKWKRVKKGGLQKLLRNFTYRLYEGDENFPLSLREISTFMHFQTRAIDVASNLKFNRLVTAPAPAGLSKEGVLLGINKHSNVEIPIYMTPEDRLRHFYVIGQTGTGKSTFLKNMIVQDIQNGDGVCMIDPHGSDIQDILANIPPERYEDVIYFDPSDTNRPMGLNMLEYDIRYPEQKTFVVNEMLSIFNKLFDMKTAGGPMFEQYFRNAVLLVMEDPDSGNTLLDVSRVLVDKSFRDLKLNRCKNPIVVQYWREVAEKAGGEASLQNIVPYITSKFDVFLSNDIMRPIVAQEKSSFNFREIMDQKKILLVNLSKGRLGDINANLLGLIIVGKILMAALSRVDSIGQELASFYLYIDEFQNVTTDSISTILSEARKYKLSLNIAHQFIAQLEEGIKDSVFGNVGSIASFRVGSEDAQFLEQQYAPVFTARDIMNIENRNAYLKILSNGSPVKPFSVSMQAPQSGNPEKIEPLKELSGLKYGKDKAVVEAQIMQKYASMNNPQKDSRPL